MALLYLPTIMRPNAGGKAKLTVEGATVSEVFTRLVSEHPKVGNQIFTPEGAVRPHVKVFVNGDDIAALEGSDTPVTDRDEVYVIAAMAGG